MSGEAAEALACSVYEFEILTKKTTIIMVSHVSV